MHDYEGFVYVICTYKNGEFRPPCKVGMTTNLTTRLGALRGANIEPLQVYCSFALPSYTTALKVEQWSHDGLSEHRLHGEWFDCSPAHAAGVVAGVVETRPRGEEEDSGHWVLNRSAIEPAIAEVA